MSLVNPVDGASLFLYTTADPVTSLLSQLTGVQVVPGPEAAAAGGST